MSRRATISIAGSVLLAILTLGGCATSQNHSTSSLLSGDDTPLAAATGPKEDAKLYSDLIGRLIKQDKLYAAMAHLEERQEAFGNTDQLRVLRADILRKMGQSAPAQAIYSQLLKGEYAAQANHGLGLIYASNDLTTGTRYLKTAVDSAPTNAQMRNDYGYALMRQEKYDKAYTQLATAYQLDDKNKLNANNFIVLLLVMGHTTRAHQVATAGKISRQTMKHLRHEAHTLSPSSVRETQPQPRTQSHHKRALSLKLTPDQTAISEPSADASDTRS